MKAVGALGTIKYGFSMIFTVLLIVLFGIGPSAIGIRLLMENEIIGVIPVIFGVLVIYAGSLGLLYKVIADAVATGNKAAPKENILSTIENYLKNIEDKVEEISEIQEE